MHLWPFLRRVLVLLTATALLAVFPGVRAHAADPRASTDVRITLELKDQPIGEALAMVAELAGRSLEVTGSIGTRKVSVILREASVQEGLQRILGSSSYIVRTSDDHLSIRVLGDSAGSDGPAVEPPQPAEESIDAPLSLFPGDEEALPGSNLTIADINYYSSISTDLDAFDVELVPLSSSEEMGLTLAEIEFFSGIHQIPDPANVELFPPESEDEHGLTLAKLQAMASGRPVLARSQIEVVPPDLPGAIGLTLEQLLNAQAKSPPAAATLVDMVPPDG